MGNYTINRDKVTLEESFKIHQKESYTDYANYIWDIVIGYYENLKAEKSYQPLENLESFISKHESDDGINWFKYKLKKLKRSYLSHLGKPRGILDCIQLYNSLKNREFHFITKTKDLYEQIKFVIDMDIRNWIESEGAYSFIIGKKVFNSMKQPYESLIQKTIKAQLENVLIKKGFNVDIIREAQLLDDKRTDFLIYYGFIGPILIELKLSTNTDLNLKKNLENSKSFKNLSKYMVGYNANFGLLFVIDNKERGDVDVGWKSI